MKVEPFALVRKPLYPLNRISLLNESDFYQRASTDASFLEALYAINASLHQTIKSYAEGKITDSKKKKKIEQTIYKYWSRACYRATPLGMFSKTSEVEVNLAANNKNQIFIRGDVAYHLELDAELILAIIQSIKADTQIRNTLLYKINNSISKAKDGHYYYYHFNTDNIKQVNYELIKFQYSEINEEIINVCTGNKSLLEIAQHLANRNSEYSPQEYITYLNDWIDSGILISNIDHCYISKNSIHKLKKELDRIEKSDQSIRWIDWLTDIHSELSTYNGKGLEKKNTKISQLLQRKIETHVDVKSHFHLDTSTVNEGENTIAISSNLISELEEVRFFLCTHFPNPIQRINDFKKEFEKRYGENPVQLVQVMNPVDGIGYTKKNEDINSIEELSDIQIQGKRDGTTHLSPIEIALSKKIITDPTSPLNLEEIVASSGDFPFHSTLAFITINDEKSVYLREFNEVSACKYLNRFSSFHSNLESVLKNIDKTEEEKYLEADKILAEYIHIQEIGMANLLKFEHGKSFQSSSIYDADGKNNIRLNDIYIKLSNGRFTIYSKSMEKEIVFTFTNSLNASYSPMNLYNFLFDLQSQENNFDLSFSWGKLVTLYHRFPRVVYKNIILMPRIWIVDEIECKTLGDLAKWKKMNKVPNQIFLSRDLHSDEQLFIDFSLDVANEIFLTELKTARKLIIKEILGDKNCKTLIYNNDYYHHELMLPLSGDKIIYQQVGKFSFFEKIKANFQIGDEWIFFKVYCTNSQAESFLSNDLIKIIEDKNFAVNIDYWFFVRYYDTGNHIRLRFHLKDSRKHFQLMESICGQLMDLINSEKIFKIETSVYEREISRYTPENIVKCEQLFHFDSINILAHFNEPDKFLVSLRIVDFYLNLFNIQLDEKNAILKYLSIGYLKEFGLGKEDRIKLDIKYRTLFKKIHSGIKSQKMWQNEKEMKQLALDIIQSGTSKNKLVEIICSLIHMSLNRFFESKPRHNELSLYYFLEKYYLQQLKVFPHA